MATQTIEAKLALAADSFNNTIDSAIGRLDDLKGGASGASKAVGTLGAAAAVGAGAAMGKGVKEFTSFDEKLTESQAIMGDLSDEMDDEMSDTARQVAKTTQHSAEDAAESYYYLASAGLDAKESTEQLGNVSEFAQAGMFDMATATDILTDANSALGGETEDMAGLSDQLVTANQNANASVEQFGESLKNKAAPAMKRMGIESEEGIAALSVFADQGLKGRRAGTIFARTLEGLESNARTNKEAFEELGVQVTDEEGNMRDMEDIIGDLEGAMDGMSTAEKNAALEKLGFNKRAKQGIDLLMGNSDELGEYKDSLEDAGGATEEVANKQMDTFNAQMGLLKDRINDIFIAIGEQLTPILADLLKPVNRAVKAFADWTEEAENAMAVTKGLAGVMGGGILVAISSLIGGLTLPMWAAIGAAAALAQAWRTNFAGVRDQTSRVASTFMSEFGPVIDQLVETGEAVSGALAPHFETGMGTIEDAIEPVVELLADGLIWAIEVAADGLIAGLELIEAAAEGRLDWSDIVTALEDSLAELASAAGEHFDALIEHLDDAIPGFESFRETVADIADAVDGALETAAGYVSDFADAVAEFMGDASDSVGDVVPSFEDMRDGVADALDTVGGAIDDAADFFGDLADDADDFVGDVTDAVGDVVPDFEDMRDGINDAIDTASDYLGDGVDAMGDMAGAAADYMPDVGAEVTDVIPDFEDLRDAADTATDAVAGRLNAASASMSNFAGDAATFMGDASSEVRGVIPSFDDITGAASSMVAGVRTQLAIAISVLTGFATTVGERMDTAGQRLLDFVPSLTTVRGRIVTWVNFASGRFAAFATNVGTHMDTAGTNLRNVFPSLTAVRGRIVTWVNFTSGRFAAFATNVGTHMSAAGTRARGVLPALVAVRSRITTWATVAAQRFASFALRVGEHMNTAGQRLRDLVPALTTIRGRIALFANVVAGLFGTLATRIGTHIGTAGERVRGLTLPLATVRAFVSTWVNAVSARLATFVATVRTIVGKITDRLPAIGIGFNDVRRTVQAALNVISLALGTFLGVLTTITGRIREVLGSLTGYISQRLGQSGGAFTALKNRTQTALNRIITKLGQMPAHLTTFKDVVIAKLQPIKPALADTEQWFRDLNLTMDHVVAAAGPILTRLLGPFGIVVAAAASMAGRFRVSMGKIVSIAQTGFNRIKNDIAEDSDTIKNEVRRLWQNITDITLNYLPPLVKIIGGSFLTIKNIISDTLARILSESVRPFLLDLFELWEIHGVELIAEVLMTYNHLLENVVKPILNGIKIVTGTILLAIRKIWDKWGEEITILVEFVFDTIFSIITVALDTILTTIRVALALLRGDWSTAWRLIGDLLDRNWERMVEFANEWAPKLYNVFSTLIVDLTLLFAGAFARFLEMLNLFLTDTYNATVNTLRKVYEAWLNRLNTIWTIFTTITGLIIESLINFFSRFLTKTATKLTEWFNNWDTILGNIWSKFSITLGNIFGALISFFSKLLTKTGTKTKEFFLEFDGSLDDIWNAFTGLYSDVVEATVNFGDTLLEKMGTGLGDVFDKVDSWTDDIYDNITGVVKNIGDWIEDTGTSVVADGFKAIAEAGKDAFNDAMPDSLDIPEISIGGGSLSIPSKNVPGLGSVGGGSLNIPSESVGGQTLDLPSLAEGGVAMDDTFAQIGEGTEPEAVAPLSKLESMMTHPVEEALQDMPAEQPADTKRAEVVKAIRELKQSMGDMDAEINEAEIEVGEDGLLRLINGQIEFQQDRSSVSGFSRNIKQ